MDRIGDAAPLRSSQRNQPDVSAAQDARQTPKKAAGAASEFGYNTIQSANPGIHDPTPPAFNRDPETTMFAGIVRTFERLAQPADRFNYRENPINQIRGFLFYFLLFAGYASAFPFLVVYYQQLGFSGAEIGLLTGLSPLITFFGAPFWTRLADSTRRHRAIMSLTMGLGILAISLIPLARAFAPVLCITLVFSFFFSPISSFADNSTMHMLGDKKDHYGRVRLGGTIGFALMAPIAGVILQNTGLRTAFWIAGALYFLGLLVSRNFDHGSSIERPAGGGLRVLLANPRVIVFLGVAFAGGLALTVSNNYFFPLLRELGAKESLMGIALSIGAVLEFPVLFFGSRLIRFFKPYGLFMVSMAITGIRLILFGLNASPDSALLIQLLAGLSFPPLMMAGIAYAHEHSPPGMGATFQGLFAAMVFGIGAAAGGFLGGPLLETLGGRGLFLVYGILTLSITGIGAAIGLLLPKEAPSHAEVSSNP
jgi:PPP family 3-phenylpropionic acid transporter